MPGPGLPLPAALAAVIALALAGCGLTDPYASQPPTTHPRTAQAIGTTVSVGLADADPVPERGGTIPASATAGQNQIAADAAEPTPAEALRKYALLYINWTAGTVPAVQDKLASISVGQARAQALQAAASYRNDTTLQASQVANAGTVVAIAPGQGPEAGSWVIVTQETTTGRGDYAGLPASDHVTYAQLQHTQEGWAVSSWSPRS